MDHDKLVKTIRTIIGNRQDPGVSRRPGDYDLEAIVAEVNEVFEGRMQRASIPTMSTGRSWRSA